MSDLAVTLGSINVSASDPPALAAFWSHVVGNTPSGGNPLYLLPAGPGGFGMFFQPLTGPRPDRQVMHMDLTVPWGARQVVVDRALAFGATYQWEVLEEHDHVQWTTLADPEGNLFCVAEHPPSRT
jgi:hypothetical protein